jgi:hypothetical protein
MHPDYHKSLPGERAVWSSQELDYIKAYVKLNKGKSNMMASCLNFMRNDENSHPIFHVFHTVDSARLRSGFDAIKKISKKE